MSEMSLDIKQTKYIHGKEIFHWVGTALGSLAWDYRLRRVVIMMLTEASLKRIKF